MAAAASLKNRKIARSRPRFDRFLRNSAQWCSSTSWPFRLLNFQKLKNPRWRRRPCFKIEKLPYLSNVLTDRREVWQNNTLWPSWPFPPLKFPYFENPRRPPSWRIEKLPDLGCDLTNFYEIWHSDAVRPYWPFRPLKFQKFKYPRWRLLPSLKIETSPYLSNGLTDCRKIWHCDAHWQVDAYLPNRQSKIRPFKNQGWCTGDVWTIKNLDMTVKVWPIEIT